MNDFVSKVQQYILSQLKRSVPQQIVAERKAAQFVDESKKQFGIKTITKKGLTP